ncbi:MAG: S8 family serine peptidase [Bacteroidota bacterium]
MKPPILGTHIFSDRLTTGSFSTFVTEQKANESRIQPKYTGRYFLVSKNQVADLNAQRKLFESSLGFKIATSSDFKEMINEADLGNADMLIYEELGIALVDAIDEEKMAMVESVEAGAILIPEKVVYVPDDLTYRVNIPATWGIQKTGVYKSAFSGKNVKVAILDTGLDLHHPDFTTRKVVSQSFVPNESVHDLNGHGTHCVGTACGDKNMAGERYGVAHEADIYVGKVLANKGSGAQSWVMNGMLWAASNGCKVVSMSLGSPVNPGETPDIAYERTAANVFAKGCIPVAAAGNDSNRSNGAVMPIGSPADGGFVLAVAALASNLSVANFSNQAVNPKTTMGIAAPGVDIHSSWPMPKRYRTLSGTSMATPHVAGILALLWEQFPNSTPAAICHRMRNLAQPLPLLPEDVGAGLAQAP